MKKIRNTVNVILSALIVALGFGSCVSQKAYHEVQKAHAEALEEIKMLHMENESLKQEVSTLKQQIGDALEYRKRMEERKVVYGPRPTGFKGQLEPGAQDKKTK